MAVSGVVPFLESAEKYLAEGILGAGSYIFHRFSLLSLLKMFRTSVSAAEKLIQNMQFGKEEPGRKCCCKLRRREIVRVHPAKIGYVSAVGTFKAYSHVVKIN